MGACNSNKQTISPHTLLFLIILLIFFSCFNILNWKEHSTGLFNFDSKDLKIHKVKVTTPGTLV